MNSTTAPPPLDGLTVRCRGEFLEMPGLRLTMQQASRLFHLDAALCEAMLNALVDAGFLRKVQHHYIRASIERG